MKYWLVHDGILNSWLIIIPALSLHKWVSLLPKMHQITRVWSLLNWIEKQKSPLQFWQINVAQNHVEFPISGELHVIRVVESFNHFLRAWHTNDIEIVFGPFNGCRMPSLRSQNPSKQDIDQTTIFTRQKRDIMLVKTQSDREKQQQQERNHAETQQKGEPSKWKKKKEPWKSCSYAATCWFQTPKMLLAYDGLQAYSITLQVPFCNSICIEHMFC